MEFISFRCTSCNQGLKVGADKAGRKIKCTKCGTPLTIPSPQKEAPPPPMEEEDDKKGYSIASAPDEGEPEAKSKKESKVKAPPIQRKLKTLPDLDQWEKVKAGLQVVSIGDYFWAGALVLMTIAIILGAFNGPEYSKTLEDAYDAATGVFDAFRFAFGLVIGEQSYPTGKTLYILAAVLALLRELIFMSGYAVCLSVPDRYGSRGQIKTLLLLGFLNFLFMLIFKLLPALGVLNYVLIPYAVPEVSLVDASIDRDPPLWVFWSGSPFWTMTLSVLLVFSFYLEPVLIGIFLWSIGMALREDPVIDKGQGIVNLTFGVAFGFLAFEMLTMTGTSGIALLVLRILYSLWIGFTILLLVRLPLAIGATRDILQKYLEGAELKDEEDEEEEPKPKRKRRPRPADEDDEEDED